MPLPGHYLGGFDLEKVKMFSWQTLQNKVHTMDVLAKKARAQEWGCILCEAYSEIMSHLLTRCSFV